MQKATSHDMLKGKIQVIQKNQSARNQKKTYNSLKNPLMPQYDKNKSEDWAPSLATIKGEASEARRTRSEATLW